MPAIGHGDREQQKTDDNGECGPCCNNMLKTQCLYGLTSRACRRGPDGPDLFTFDIQDSVFDIGYSLRFFPSPFFLSSRNSARRIIPTPMVTYASAMLKMNQ